MWWGVALAQWLLKHRRDVITGSIAPLAPFSRWLAWLGTWSLTWYMLHQPLMIGMMSALKAL
jgi:peptidoglycan/LPS O-acetylase OafA/YrhL